MPAHGGTGGRFPFSLNGTIRDTGAYDFIDTSLPEVPIAELPDDVLVYLLGSRYCETDHLSALAWKEFGTITPGWTRVQAIVDFVHRRLKFGYPHARATRTAAEAYQEQVGVCRDFAHLTIALCRCLNIPARYVNGYLGDIGVPKDPAPMDFSAWCEVYLGGRWCTFDARHNKPRIGRIVVAHGRDATDVPLLAHVRAARLEHVQGLDGRGERRGNGRSLGCGVARATRRDWQR